MEDWSGFRGTFGCLFALFDAIILLYAIFSIIEGEGTPFTWSILIGAVMDILIKFLVHWSINRRNYNRKDSYWSKKDEPEDTANADK